MPAAHDHDYSFGIEEEFFLVHPSTRHPVRRPPRRLLRRLERDLGDQVTAELLQSQIEIASPVFDNHADAARTMARLRGEVAAAAAQDGLAILAAGTHPLARWHVQTGTPSPRYQALIDDYAVVARRSLVCALHIHVAPPPGVDRVQVMNRALPWLPLFLALSAASPFWRRRYTGLMGYRQVAYSEWPRTGIPDRFADQAEYDAFAAWLARCGAIADAAQLWWAIRPSLRYPTLELRIADSCTRLEHALALAALFRCLIRALVRDPRLGGAEVPGARRIVDENRWRAARWGAEARFIDLHGGGQTSAADMLRDLKRICAEDIRAFRCTRVLAPLRKVLAGEGSAQCQIAVFRSRREAGASQVDAMRAVVDWLLRTTVPPSP